MPAARTRYALQCGCTCVPCLQQGRRSLLDRPLCTACCAALPFVHSVLCSTAPFAQRAVQHSPHVCMRSWVVQGAWCLVAHRCRSRTASRRTARTCTSHGCSPRSSPQPAVAARHSPGEVSGFCSSRILLFKGFALQGFQKAFKTLKNPTLGFVRA